MKKLKYIVNILDEYRKPVAADKRNQNAEVLYPYYGASGKIDLIDGYTIDNHVMLIGEDGANLRMRNLPLMYEVREFKEDSVVPVNTFVVDEYNAKIIGNKVNKYVISRDKETLKRYKYMWERRKDE